MLLRTSIGVLFPLLLLAGCHTDRPTARPTEISSTVAVKSAWNRTEIFFGRGKPDGSQVTDAEWDEFMDHFVTPRFPQGLTVLEAQGRWKGNSGKIVKEASKILVLVYQPSPENTKKLDEICTEYKTKFQQEALLKVTQGVDVSF